MNPPPRIAVLMTCFNRRALTLACLDSLRDQAGFAQENLFLVDDGSTDGTAQAVLAAMPGARVVPGDGSLFWNGGMRRAWNEAKARADATRQPFDFYLWLNDDVRLSPGTLAMLVADADATVARGEAVIVSAAVTEPASGKVIYGAQRRPDPGKPLRLMLLAPEGRPLRADTVSGNVVLVSRAAEAGLGNLLDMFEHIYGDLDYGLRASAAGIPVMLASRPGGLCGANSHAGTSLDESLGVLARLRLRWREDGKIHARDWRRFVRLHGGGALAPIKHRIAPYLRILLARPNRYGTTILNTDVTA